MKKIINGKLYNTESAKLLAEFDSPLGKTDFNYYEEKLYKKKTGEFFLYGYGHAASRYAEPVDGSTYGPGETIMPLTEEQAREWSEKNLIADKYLEMFTAEE